MVGVNTSPSHAEIVIAGGGIIGLALGLELQLRGATVTIFERGHAMRAASWAAGGMLAVADPQNPPELMPLARLSRQLYPDWLRSIEDLSGIRVPLRTQHALQWVECDVREELATAQEIRALAPALHANGQSFRLLDEGSVDPRDLCSALPKAFTAAGGTLIEGCGVLEVVQSQHELRVRTTGGEFLATHFVNCCGAWAGAAIEGLSPLPVGPVKGHMVELACTPDLLKCVVRAPGVYLIPRGDGRITVGATLERVGFDDRVDDHAVTGLIHSAQTLLPQLDPPQPLNAWAGLRPGTPDALPVMGPALSPAHEEIPNSWHATGHYRDGILLAPATARVMAQALAGNQPAVPLEPFSAHRFTYVPTLR